MATLRRALGATVNGGCVNLFMAIHRTASAEANWLRQVKYY